MRGGRQTGVRAARLATITFLLPFLLWTAGSSRLAARPREADPGQAFLQDATGPLIQVSGPSPFSDCTADMFGLRSGTLYRNSEVETWVVANPTNPANVVGVWQQDRWSNGGARGLVTGASFDGGLTWQSVVVPGISRCSGGLLPRASDPWVSFGPDGSLYHVALSLTPGFTSALLVNKSTDGGLTWGAPVSVLQSSLPRFNDKETLTADPLDPDLVYVIWDQVDTSRNRAPTLFARSTDGGLSFEPPSVVHDAGPDAQTLGNRILVLPDGTLLAAFTEIRNLSSQPAFRLGLKRSTDRGVTWEPPAGLLSALFMEPLGAFEPSSEMFVRDGAGLFDVAVDPVDGSLSMVWQDGRFGGSVFDSVAFSMSRDGGLTWAEPVPVNRTPRFGTDESRQAFLPAVAVAGNGTVGITYYDFRHNEGASLTDQWFIRCHPGASDCANPERWRETRITDEPFDISRAPVTRQETFHGVVSSLFLGDYVGLTSTGSHFLTFFAQTHDTDRSSAFARRVEIVDPIDPRELVWWRHQAEDLLAGRPEAGEEEILEALADVHALFDVFDDVDGIDGIRTALKELEPPAPRALLRREVMVLLLNLTSLRLPPYLEAVPGERLTRTIAGLITVLQDPTASPHDLTRALVLTRKINANRL